MLKLLKYEWKACARTCLPLYGALLLMSIVSCAMYSGKAAELLHGIPSALIAMLYFGVLVAVFVVTTVLLIQRFYKNLLGSEGYLMFTLPVTVSQHILSKAIIAAVMTLLGGCVTMLSVCVMSAGTGTFSIVGNMLIGFVKQPAAIVFLLELVLLAALGVGGVALFIYLCIALGHLAKKHRLLMAVVWYFVLSMALQFVMLTVMTGAAGMLPQGLLTAIGNVLGGITPAGALHMVMLTLCAVAAVGDAVYFFATRYILKNHLNLE